jgi:hypothetical protein
MTCSPLRIAYGRVAALGLGLSMLPACGEILGVESDPVLHNDCIGTLRVRITTDNSGSATDTAPPYNNGIYDYLRHLNESEGGLRGCPIDIDMQDAQYDPAETEKVVERWRQQPEWPEVSTLFIFGTGPTTLVAAKEMEEKRIIIPGSYAGSLASPVRVAKDVSYPQVSADGQSISTSERKESPGYPYVFFPATDYSTAIRIAIQSAWAIAPGRIAMVHDTAECAYCVDPLAAGKSYVELLPNMLLGEDLVVPQTTNDDDEPVIIDKVTAYIQKEIDKKLADPDYVPVSWLWTGNSVFSSSLVGKAAAAAQRLIDEQIEERHRWTLQVMANNWGIGETTPAFCGSDCNGIFYGLFPVPRYGDLRNSVGMDEMMRIHDDYRRKDGHDIEDYRDVRYVQGYAAALMWRRAVEQAIDAGHNTPTGTDLKNALESFDQVRLDGMTAGPISFSAADHRPQSNEAIYKINDRGDLEFVDRYSIRLDPEWLGY